jgi:hypothetical protein
MRLELANGGPDGSPVLKSVTLSAKTFTRHFAGDRETYGLPQVRLQRVELDKPRDVENSGRLHTVDGSLPFPQPRRQYNSSIGRAIAFTPP